MILPLVVDCSKINVLVPLYIAAGCMCAHEFKCKLIKDQVLSCLFEPAASALIKETDIGKPIKVVKKIILEN